MSTATVSNPTGSSPTGTPSVSLRGLTKTFGGSTVVDDLDLDIASGEFFSLLGPSGCGKTTTLRMIAGFSDPTAGTILVGGEDVTSTPPHQRDVNTVFQSYALFEHLDVRRNVGFGLRRKGLDKRELDQRVSQHARARRARRPGQGASEPAVRRPAAARRARPGPDQRAQGAPARRAVGRPRPQAAARDAGRAQVDPARGRHHLPVRHPRPGRGAEHERPGRDHERRRHRAVRHARGRLRAPDLGLRGRLHRHQQPDERHLVGPAHVTVAPGISVPAPEHRGSAEGDAVSVAVRPEKIWLSDLTPEMFCVPGTIVATVYHGSTTQHLVSIAPTSPSRSWSRTSPGCGPRTAGTPATGSRSAGCPSTRWSCGEP